MYILAKFQGEYFPDEKRLSEKESRGTDAKRSKIALLLCLMGAALFTGAEALRSLRRPPEAFPEEIYAPFRPHAERPPFFLRGSGGYNRGSLDRRMKI